MCHWLCDITLSSNEADLTMFTAHLLMCCRKDTESMELNLHQDKSPLFATAMLL